MEYVASHTSIPVPRIIHSSLDPTLDNVQSPYVVMSKVEGTSLNKYWDDMPDAQRDIVLKQVVDILLELSSHRFDKIGSIFKAGDGSWHIEPTLRWPSDDIPDAMYTSGTDEFLSIANTRLQKIRDERFGALNDIDYIQYWFMRSLIPSLYDNSLDTNGFPLMHGDFNFQNIFVVDVDTHPRITAIIDWDDTTALSTSSFAQYPIFIVDHPVWEEDHPLRPRNAHDQASFNRLFAKAEREKFPNSATSLSRAFANCKGLYLFEQIMFDEFMYRRLFDKLVDHVFGPDGQEYGWYSYMNGLEDGILKDVVERLKEEVDVAEEAKEVLGDKFNNRGRLSRTEFIKLAREFKDLLPAEGKVVAWLVKETEGERDH
jgi:hypothetical protein